MHNQSYRGRLRELLEMHLPGAEVYDPLADHSNSLEYNDEQARQVFLRHNQMCGEVDLVIAFAPEATMGTAIEMWEAKRHGKRVVTISPLTHNWVIKFCSDWLFETVESFEEALVSGELARRLCL